MKVDRLLGALRHLRTMDDPWDVKSVRQSGQYISCMKISGVPLLPPVLSKECRKEMQYYKLLAKEVEKRITLLQPLMSDNSVDSEDITDAPELPEYEQCYELLQGDIRTDPDINTDKIKANSPTQSPKSSAPTSPIFKDSSNMLKSTSPLFTAPNFIIDLSLSINETGRKVLDTSHKVHSVCLSELPERDYNQISKITKKERIEKEVIFELNGKCNNTNNFHGNFCIIGNRGLSSDPLSGIPLSQEGPSSLSSKSFTGSLNDIHSESIKDSQIESSKLVRQSSYTLLHPSPHLLAHLEIHARDKGVAMNSISMSESLSDVATPIKKRKGWDLDSAKEKWSKMALELKEKNVVNTRANTCKNVVKPVPKQINQSRAKSVVSPPHKRNNLNNKTLPKSEPLCRTKRQTSPVRISDHNRALPSQPPSKNTETQIHVPKPISESEDPATRVRELYEKIQSRQLAQMTSLLEKQKKEQMLLQQVFEEQNNLLFKQLKIICPKSPFEAKAAWSDKLYDGDRGPVSLSQLINCKSPENNNNDSSISSTLTDTNKYINHCDNVLQKSRDITGSIKKEQYKSRSQNGTKIQSPKTLIDGSRTRTHSPVRGNNTISRKLNYDTSMSSEQNEPILTDRTNDTMADLNVTFPSDHSDEFKSTHSNSLLSHASGKKINSDHAYMVHTNITSTLGQPKSPENIIKRTHNAVGGLSRATKIPPPKSIPTPQERAAATKIVAYVKGYLVRRLMRTERVQGTVQTIKDALLCALQLHQDREGIRGADVDLHRRLIQQITAACYSLHDTFVASTPAERCAIIAADRGRRRSLAARQPTHTFKQTDLMSQSHSGTFPARAKRTPPSLMTQSNYETFSGDKSSPVSRRYVASPHRRPWR